MYLAFDIGGTKVAYSLLTKDGEEIKKGIIIHKGRVMRVIRNILKQESNGVIGVGYSIAGQVVDNKVIRSPNLKDIEGKDMIRITNNILPSAKVIVKNDADCFALSQYYTKYTNKDILFALVWGTGIGGGIVYKGEIIEGKNGLGGEIGHVTYKSNGRKCGCGKRGCYEAYLGGWYLDNIAIKMGKEHLDYSSPVFYNITLPIFTNLIKTIILTINPDVIVIGGGIGRRIKREYINKVKERIKEEISFKFDVIIDKAKEEEGIKGCYYLLNKYFKN